MKRVVIAQSALKRGHCEDDILHALRQIVDAFAPDDEGLTMVVGPTCSGQLVEIGFVVASDDALVVVHVMNARTKFLR